ncbi:Transcription termination factor, mitochondrial/chloroplastic [Sesbania bispinosa]|nr:Transcription termination factor, mitochondrial/chloroplastic [Sesbania bispinosa]
MSRVLSRSLENNIIPLYELFKRFLKSDKDVITYLILCWSHHTMANIKLMIDYRVFDLSIARLFVPPPTILASTNLLKSLDEVKGLRVDPSKSTFGVALVARKGVSKSRWDEKVDAFKKWGWSDENVLQTFRKQPNVMPVSNDRINLVMSLWVNQMGWNSLALTKGPEISGYNFQKRTIQRATVLQFLLKKGLWKKNASLLWPFSVPDQVCCRFQGGV